MISFNILKSKELVRILQTYQKKKENNFLFYLKIILVIQVCCY